MWEIMTRWIVGPTALTSMHYAKKLGLGFAHFAKSDSYTTPRTKFWIFVEDWSLDEGLAGTGGFDWEERRVQVSKEFTKVVTH